FGLIIERYSISLKSKITPMDLFYLRKFLFASLIIFGSISCNSSQTSPGDSTADDEHTTGVDNNHTKDHLSKKHKLDKITLPEGFRIEVYAEVPNARSMALSPEGTLYVGTQKKSVYAIPDKNQDGKAD